MWVVCTDRQKNLHITASKLMQADTKASDNYRDILHCKCVETFYLRY